MRKIDITKLDSEAKLLADEVLQEVFEEPNEIERAKLLLALRDKAMLLKCAGKFDAMVNAYKKVDREMRKQQKTMSIQSDNKPFDNYTNFDYFDDGHELYCGAWMADQNGVRSFDMFGEHIACYHPILITKRLTNAETGREKVRLAFCKGFKWREITVDKGVIASSTKIVQLADQGVSVTSETSKLLVRFLSDLENLNINNIEDGASTGKFGWISDGFMPYDKDIEFDAESRFRDIYESIRPHGDFDTWLNLMKKIRAGDRYEPQLYMAGSFASVLLKPLNVLPFVLNLWGETGKGKTVALMVAASIWANPAENRYITDPVSSQVAIEVREDVLNNLPIMIDDLSKTRDKYQDGFTDLIYMLCGGKGKDRSNTSLGLNKATNWQNICLTNIERPLATDTMRGGAINRILDFEMEDGSIFQNGNRVVSTISKNYGFAGEMFVRIIQQMDVADIKSMQEDFLAKINARAAELGQEKEEKQSIPLSVLLTADKIATDEIFLDGIYLDLNRCVDALKNKGDVSENDRAYEFILSEVSMNPNSFIPDDEGNYRGQRWGKYHDGYVIIISNAFDKICERGNFSRKAFLQWANKKGIIQTDGRGQPTKTCRFGDSSPKCIWIKIPNEDVDENGWIKWDWQEKLPFD